MLHNKRQENKGFLSTPTCLNKKGQVGETMTWIVATLIIIVILSISVFATTILSSTNKKLISLNDKKKDFVATVSITNFLRNEGNVNLINSGDENQIEGKMKLLLQSLPVSFSKNILEKTKIISMVKTEGGWNFEVLGGKRVVRVMTFSTKGHKGVGSSVETSRPNFELKFSLGQKKLIFWAECPGGKCK